MHIDLPALRQIWRETVNALEEHGGTLIARQSLAQPDSATVPARPFTIEWCRS